ncbi:exodeoxyribonuclease V subunit alpha [Ectothiorhodospira variabilis]|uniref:exodeoxyribonuclease V subunit alpha n=1 Tax=Ectothiorhodospira variabilis TaxID=505694 RepID=UPI001EFBEFB7|nr:exodeoxyribonuclease V subunit alpha [Ectothiorhodospira variabilis]MCG5494075.1 exodeoxyribonuclease V subunit alpha [Ectothiorhodospira variabilis]MCG5503395.1 exodeoxyribonuclease V subunit alpha [Ectothiorhodospira variabilis]MCG5506517.1 exodeoxyribonuclease V subunit alpha [Ectothiorhodospira variabilis]
MMEHHHEAHQERPAHPTLALLGEWAAAGAIRALDLSLTRFIHTRAPEDDPAVLLAIALTSERNGHGHVCLDLAQALHHPQTLLTRLRDNQPLAQDIRLALARELGALTLTDWAARLRASSAISRAEDARDPGDPSPLVLDGDPERPLLYLRRYWAYEQRIAEGIQSRLQQPLPIPEAPLARLLDTLFQPVPDQAPSPVPDWQRLACALAARSGFFILTGGPGTGKTTTVVRLLALLQRLAAVQGQPALRIELAAPTGKAAARLNESINAQVNALPPPEGITGEVGPIPTRVKTLHRLLGPRPDSRRFRHHPGNPLAADVVVVDEASMVDVEMMVHLLSALRPEARLILLGDKDQLASVEAGAVLGDLCQRAQRAHYTPDTRDWLARVSGQDVPKPMVDANGQALDQAVAMLRTSHRFSDQGGIGALAARVNDAGQDPRDPDGALAAVRLVFEQSATEPDSPLGSVAAIQLDDEADPRFDERVREGYAGYLHRLEQAPDDPDASARVDAWAHDILQAQRQFQLLTALRDGPWGVTGLNTRIIQVLRAARLLPGEAEAGASGQRQWFAGRPVLITRNDYSLNLMNGDIGITLPVPVRQGGERRTVLRVAFPGEASQVRWVLPSRLQAVETVFAMTVHKSQGSEFEHTALVLPDAPNPVLTRELLYTAITRSRSRFTLLYTQASVLGEAITRRVSRDSGLGERLLRRHPPAPAPSPP